MFHQIVLFQTAAKFGNFKEAASYLYTTPGEMDRQIKVLEMELGAELLHRSKHGFSLTSAGSYFFEKSLELIPMLDELFADTVHMAHREKRSLYVGCHPANNGREFQSAVARFTASHPDLQIHIICDAYEWLYPTLHRGYLDLVVAGNEPVFRDNFHSRRLAAMQCFVELPSMSRLTRQAGVEVSQLGRLTAIAAAPPELQKSCRSFYEDMAGSIDRMVFVESLSEARRRVARGEGYTIVNSEDRVKNHPGLTAMLLTKNGEPFIHSYNLFWPKRGASALVQDFGDYIRSAFPPGLRKD